jgi:hypothetical protein
MGSCGARAGELARRSGEAGDRRVRRADPRRARSGEERVAVLDNEGTLSCEKPMPIQLDFILCRLVKMAEADPALRERQPWKAA